MLRYRLGLAVIAGLVAGAVLFTVLRPTTPPPANAGAPVALLPDDQRNPAPELTGIEGWINSPPLTLAGLRGRVVLIDFWTFSCVNCVRTIPHLRQLYDAYRGSNFVLLGIHSPEFDFERVRANVAEAVRRLGVTWPVALDSEMATWRVFSNNVWPAEYLIDTQGRIAYINLGEGNYDVTDRAVAALLGRPQLSGGDSGPAVPNGVTPELYAGGLRGLLADTEAYGPSGRPTTYADPGPPRGRDVIQVVGTWTDYGEYLAANSPAHVRVYFHAADVFVVAGSAAGIVAVSVALDGQPAPAAFRGPALVGSAFSVNRHDLFHLLAGVGRGYHLIDLSVPAGFRLYTFTFG